MEESTVEPSIKAPEDVLSPTGPMPLWKRPVFTRALIILAFLLVLGWVFSPVITRPYGWNDDFHLLKRVAEGSYKLSDNESLQVGRPLLALANAAMFSIPHSVASLKEARIISVVGLFIFALLADKSLRSFGYRRDSSAAFALLACLTPGFAIYAGWLADGPNIYASAMGLAAGYLFALGLDEKKLAKRVGYIGVGAILLLASYATYQVAAGFAVLPLFAQAWRGLEMDWARAKKFTVGIGFILAMAAFYFVAYKVFVALCHIQGEAHRTALATNLFGNLRFAFTAVLWSGITGWTQFNPKWVQCIAALIVTSTIVYGNVRNWWRVKSSLPALFCLLVAFIVTILPLLVVKEIMFAFRTQTALHALVPIAFLLGVERCFEGRFAPFWKRGRILAFVALVGLMAGLTRLHLRHDFVEPNVRECRALARALQEFKDFPTTLVYTTPPQLMQPKDGVIGEYRYPSSPWVWVAPSMLELLLIQNQESDVPLKVALQRHAGFSVKYGPKNPDHLPALDGFVLFCGTNLSVRDDPYWGKIRVWTNGWCVSDWFGVFDKTDFPSVYQCQLGWLYCTGKGSNDFWFASPRYGNMWTEPKSYPSLYFVKKDTWYWLSPEFRDPWFVNLKDGKWTAEPNE